MLSAVRYFLADAADWVGRRLRSPAGAVAGVLVVAALAAGVLYATGVISGGEEPSQPAAPAPPIVVREQAAPAEAQDVGFPAFATKNTTRVSGADPAADASGVALAVYPSTGSAKRPNAVAVVDSRDWAAGIAASVLAAAPVDAPLLVSAHGELSTLGSNALDALDPPGSAATGDAQLFRVGTAAAKVKGLTAEEVRGTDPAAIANEVDRLREKLTGEQPGHIVVASSEEPAYAMPAAAWAARSGDPVLFSGRHKVPAATLEALRRHEGVPVYVLGPESVISADAVHQLERVAPVARVGADGPVENAIAFARYSAPGGFGWNINDPGHGFVIAASERPLDAAAAAPLSASGTWGPLLVSDRRDQVPAELQAYLLDLKPGYIDDPTRAVYNHVWLIGDESALSVAFQAHVDDLAEVAPVRSGTGNTALEPVPPAPGGKDRRKQESERKR